MLSSLRIQATRPVRSSESKLHDSPLLTSKPASDDGPSMATMKPIFMSHTNWNDMHSSTDTKSMVCRAALISPPALTPASPSSSDSDSSKDIIHDENGPVLPSFAEPCMDMNIDMDIDMNENTMDSTNKNENNIVNTGNHHHMLHMRKQERSSSTEEEGANTSCIQPRFISARRLPLHKSDANALMCFAAHSLVQLRHSEEAYETINQQSDDDSYDLGHTNQEKINISGSSTNNSNTRATQGLRLSLPEDHQELNSLHCFVRTELLELFCLPDNTNHKDTLPTNTPNSINKKRRIGLRCVFCSHLPRRERIGCSTMSTFYPKSLNDIYRNVCTWQRLHFRACRHVPPDVRDAYNTLKQKDKSRGKTKYWVSSARILGLVDVENGERGGVCFAEKYKVDDGDQGEKTPELPLD